MYEELVKKLRYCGNAVSCIHCPYWEGCGGTKDDLAQAADSIENLLKALDAVNDAHNEGFDVGYWAGRRDYEQKWISVTERLPKCEQEVLICTEKKIVGKDAYIDSIVTPAIYEDGTMIENNSIWRWEDIDYTGWDEEEDCGIIPEGWWENRHFNPDEVYNNPVDRKVIAWMSLPEPPKEDK